MTLREAQGTRLKAHGKAIIQLKVSYTLRLWPCAFGIDIPLPLALRLYDSKGEKWPRPEPAAIVYKKGSMPTHLNVTKMSG